MCIFVCVVGVGYHRVSLGYVKIPLVMRKCEKVHPGIEN